MSTVNFDFRGIGKILQEGKLKVPLNQREYAWDEENVKDLCEDLAGAMREGKDSYFLGTIVLTQTSDSRLEVVDGQQRLATCTMLLAGIRDILKEMERSSPLIGSIESKYLLGIDIDSEEEQANLILNTRDHTCFLESVLRTPSERRERNYKNQAAASNELIRNGFNTIKRFLSSHLESIPKSGQKDELITPPI